jgi:hypothetical protein
MSKELSKDISKFGELVQRGIDAWLEAGKLVVKILDDDPGAVAKICAANPWITPEIVMRFQDIGLGMVLPALMLSDAPGVRMLRGMPIEVQEQYQTQPVPCLMDSSGTMNKIHVTKLTKAEAERVFGPDGVRSIDQQRAYLKGIQRPPSEPRRRVKLPGRREQVLIFALGYMERLTAAGFIQEAPTLTEGEREIFRELCYLGLNPSDRELADAMVLMGEQDRKAEMAA